jgi:hypothetical protein
VRLTISGFGGGLQMTLTEFARDVIPIIQAVLTALGLASLWFVWRQMGESRRWNQLNAVVTLTNLDRIAKTDQAIGAAFEAIGIDLSSLDRPLTGEEVALVRGNSAAISAVSDHLTDLENLAIALAEGVADDSYARAIHGPRVFLAWRAFTPLIELLRQDAGGSDVLKEIERTALRWREQELLAELSRGKEEAQIRRLQRRIAKLENNPALFKKAIVAEQK